MANTPSNSASAPGAGRSKRGGLGRGLESLIPTGPTRPAPSEQGDASNTTGAREVSVDAIRPNPYQPRTVLDKQRLDELAASIRTHGLMQPLIVTEATPPGTYELIAGERRWRASRLAGLRTVTVIVREATPQARLELAIVENVVRADLSPIEEALAYRHLIDDFGLSQAEIGERVGRSRVTITNTLRLLSSPEQVQAALMEERITEGHARALLGLPSLADQVAALKMVLDRSLNVRQTEEMVRRWMSLEQRAESALAARPAEVVHFEERLRSALGTCVNLKKAPNGSGSTLTIQFFSDEQLQEFYNRLAGEDVW